MDISIQLNLIEINYENINKIKLLNIRMRTGNSSPTGRWWMSVIGAAGRASLDLFPLAMSRNSSVYSYGKNDWKREKKNKFKQNKTIKKEKYFAKLCCVSNGW